MAEKLVSFEQLAELTGLSIRTLRTLVYRRAIPCTRLGHRTVRFSPTKVQRALDRYEVKAVGDR
jgi:excisionase family DNA binding protein